MSALTEYFLAAASLSLAAFATGCSEEEDCRGVGCQCVAVADCPGVATQCGSPKCTHQKCGIDAAPAGSPCSENGGNLCNGAGNCVVGTISFPALAAAGEPSARSLHTAVWVGDKMVVWGGENASGPLGDGAAYDPKSDSWTPMASAGAPTARHSHRAIALGGKMLVWGGFGASSYSTDGAAYDPKSDSWTALATEGAPTGRSHFSMSAADNAAIVWGGLRDKSALGDGASYSPAANAWTALPSGGPTKRFSHAAVWTGSEMLIWGGTDTFDWFAHGHRYDAGKGAWTTEIATSGAPTTREIPSAAWTGSAMLIWGGWAGGPYRNDGALYDPAGNSWKPMPSAGAPAERARHASVWADTELFVWGGCGGDLCGTVYDDGGRFTAAGGWVPLLPETPLGARSELTGVWTGTEVILFGGVDAVGAHVASGYRAKL